MSWLTSWQGGSVVTLLIVLAVLIRLCRHRRYTPYIAPRYSGPWPREDKRQRNQWLE
jgi:hypothetical protein